MKDGRLVIDVGEERRNKFKSKLYLKGQTMKEFFVKSIDNFLKESEVKE